MKMLFPLLASLLLAGCEKDAPTIATVLVRNQAGQAVPGATVMLQGKGASDSMSAERFDLNLLTDGTGKAAFDFTDYYKDGQSGFAVLDITASKGSLSGSGLIEVEGEQTTEELIIIE